MTKKVREIDARNLVAQFSRDSHCWLLTHANNDGTITVIKGYNGRALNLDNEELTNFIIQELRTNTIGTTIPLSEHGGLELDELEDKACAYFIEFMKNEDILDGGKHPPELFDNNYGKFLACVLNINEMINDPNHDADEQSDFIINSENSDPITYTELIRISESFKDYESWIKDIFAGKSLKDILLAAERGDFSNDVWWMLSGIQQEEISQINDFKELGKRIDKAGVEFEKSDLGSHWIKYEKTLDRATVAAANYLSFFFYGNFLFNLFCLIHKKSPDYFAERTLIVKKFGYLGESFDPKGHRTVLEIKSDFMNAQAYVEFSNSQQVSQLFISPENRYIEYKTTLRKCWPQDPKAEGKSASGQNIFLSGGKKFTSLKAVERSIEGAALKSIVGFLNSEEGGNLIFGVHEFGTEMEYVGIGFDSFQNEDEYCRELSGMIERDIGASFLQNHIDISFHTFAGVRLCLCKVKPYIWPEGGMPVFLKRSFKGASEEDRKPRCFVRFPASTSEIEGPDLMKFNADRIEKWKRQT